MNGSTSTRNLHSRSPQLFVPTKVDSNLTVGSSLTDTLPKPNLFQSLLFDRENVYKGVSVPPERKLTKASGDTTPSITAVARVARAESRDLPSFTHAHKAEEEASAPRIVTVSDLSDLESGPTRSAINHADTAQMGPKAASKKAAAKPKPKSSSVKPKPKSVSDKPAPSRVAKRQPVKSTARTKEVKKQASGSSGVKSEGSIDALIVDDDSDSLFVPENETPRTNSAQEKQLQELKAKVLELESKNRGQEKEICQHKKVNSEQGNELSQYKKTNREQENEIREYQKTIREHEEQFRKQIEKFKEQTRQVHVLEANILEKAKQLREQEKLEHLQAQKIENLLTEGAQNVKEIESLKTAASARLMEWPIPCPVPTSSDDGKSKNNIRQMYVRMKSRYDRLHKSAIDLKLAFQSMDLNMLGYLGQQMKQLKTVLEENDRIMQEAGFLDSRNHTPSL